MSAGDDFSGWPFEVAAHGEEPTIELLKRNWTKLNLFNGTFKPHPGTCLSCITIMIVSEINEELYKNRRIPF
ncbi:hypothetical protein [Rossellomorea sp. BNER]|uniref:hypothetical protein n=1 Tax=Rossellomorea sp. BNER TaxID=2962031 RepID=UPI003AF27258|nr:hypothetical protein [Rossellomorea sp. BNER]